MSYEEEFDRIMREKADEFDFPFDEAHWEKASKLIAKNRDGSGVTFAKIAAGIVAIGGVITALVLLSPDEARHETAAQSSSTPATEISPVIPARAPENSEPTSQQVVSEKPVIVTSVPENNNVNTGRAEISLKRKATPVNPGTPSQASANTDANVPVKTTSQDALAPSEKVNASNISVPAVVAANNVSSSGENASQANDVAANETAEESQQAEVLSSRFSFVEYGAKNPEIIPQRLNQIKGPDYYKKTVAPITFYLDAYGGGAYSNGWQYSGTTDGRGASWFGGVTAGYFLNKCFSVASGLQAYNIANISQPFYSATSTNYDFSSVTTRTTITSENLIYMAVPIHITYHINNQSNLRLGVYASQLVHASTSVENSTILDNEVKEKSTNKNNDVYYGMTQQLFMASAGYNQKVGKRVWVNAELVYGLNPLFSPETYGGITAKPAAFRLGIAYRLLEK